MVASFFSSTFFISDALSPYSTTDVPGPGVSHMTVIAVWVGYWRYGAMTNLGASTGGWAWAPAGPVFVPGRSQRTAANATATAKRIRAGRVARGMWGPKRRTARGVILPRADPIEKHEASMWRAGPRKRPDDDTATIGPLTRLRSPEQSPPGPLRLVPEPLQLGDDTIPDVPLDLDPPVSNRPAGPAPVLQLGGQVQ